MDVGVSMKARILPKRKPPDPHSIIPASGATIDAMAARARDETEPHIPLYESMIPEI